MAATETGVPLSRRAFVRLLGIVAASGVFAACSPNAPPEPTAPSAAPTTGVA